MALKRKRCSDCQRLRVISHFYINKRMRDGYVAICKDCWSERSRRWHRKHQKTINARHKQAMIDLRQEVLDVYGGECACCGEKTPEFLTIDHVKNDGKVHRQDIGWSIYRWLKKNGFPKRGFQLLCYNCNMAKARYGKCPHRRKK